jgi:YD repeat-containing protein
MGDAVSYGYYTDKPSAINDALAMQQFLTYGVIAYKSAHLCKSFQAATISQTYAYTMDDKGNISTMTTTDNKTGKTTGTTQFTYDCN